MAALVVPLIVELDGHAVSAKAPELLFQTVAKLLLPLPFKKARDLIPPVQELGAVAPCALFRVCGSDANGVTGIPKVFGELNLASGNDGIREGWRNRFGHMGKV